MSTFVRLCIPPLPSPFRYVNVMHDATNPMDDNSTKPVYIEAVNSIS